MSEIDLDTAFSDISTKIERDPQGLIVAVRTQDTTPYLEANRRAFNEAPSWRPYSNVEGMREIADIPMIVVEQWMKEGVNLFSTDREQRKKVRQKLNSNEFSHLRTYPGLVSG